MLIVCKFDPFYVGPCPPGCLVPAGRCGGSCCGPSCGSCCGPSCGSCCGPCGPCGSPGCTSCPCGW
ncbi:male-specific sperm protein Mst84Dd [Drosophila hydei]|uniref:Male-specific sperm protein Mst84Dd n=1 Tax=Drosophila hydei TaxID=7224 RepID=A0A6J2SWR1_DROHY|nr:male-specific sperm protein Mst84Dd [Drosophila hydei]